MSSGTSTTKPRRQSARLKHQEPEEETNAAPVVPPESLEAAPAIVRAEAPFLLPLGLGTCFFIILTGLGSFLINADPMHVVASVAAELLVALALICYRAGWLSGFKRFNEFN